MRPAVAGLMCAASTLALSQSAFADAYAGRGPGPVTWHLAAGYSEPTGQIASYLQGGWAVGGGFTYAPNGSPLGLRADVSFNSHTATHNFIDYGTQLSGTQVDGGTGQFFSFALGPSLTVPFVRNSRLYGFAQLGLYQSSLQLTQTALFAGDFCDPYFGYCRSGLAVGDIVVYNDSRTRVGWNGGVGIDFRTAFGPTYFVEASYHRLAGPQAIEYIPLQFGVRF